MDFLHRQAIFKFVDLHRSECFLAVGERVASFHWRVVSAVCRLRGREREGVVEFLTGGGHFGVCRMSGI